MACFSVVSNKVQDFTMRVVRTAQIRNCVNVSFLGWVYKRECTTKLFNKILLNIHKFLLVVTALSAIYCIESDSENTQFTGPMPLQLFPSTVEFSVVNDTCHLITQISHFILYNVWQLLRNSNGLYYLMVNVLNSFN